MGAQSTDHLCLSATGLLEIRFYEGNSFGKETVDTAFLWRIAEDGMEKGQGSEITGARKEVSFQPDYVVPLKSLLDPNTLPSAKHLSAEVKNTLPKLIQDIARPLLSETEIETSNALT